jgi:hypothetical protein
MPDSDEWPLSVQQRAMLDFIGDRVDSHYVNVETFRIVGPLDVAALRRALSEVCQRHDMLRSAYPRGRDTYRVLPCSEELVDRILEVSDGWADLADALAEGVRRGAAPMALDDGPPLRLWLGRVDATHAVLVVTGHYVVFDGWSFTLFYADLSAAYRRNRAGGAELSRPPQYREFPFEAPAGALDGWTDMFDAPYKRCRELSGQVGSGWGPAAVLRQSWGTAPRATELAARSFRVTPYVVGIAAMLRALSDTLDDPQVIVGSAYAGRTSADSANVIGFFANTVFLYADLREVSSTPELVRHVDGQLRSWLRHPRTQWQPLLEHYAATDAYVAKVAFHPDEFAQPTLTLDGTTTERLPAPAGASARRPFELVAGYAHDSVTTALTYREDVVTEATATGLLTRFADRLGEIV